MSTVLRVFASILMIAYGVVTFAYEGIKSASPGRDLGIGSPTILAAIALICGIGLLLMDKQDFERATERVPERRPR